MEGIHEHRVPRNRQMISQDHSPSLEPVLFWIVTGSPLSSDHCVLTVNIQSKHSKPQTTNTKLNINKANWHISTSNEA